MTGPEEKLAPEPTGGVDTVAFAWLPAGDYEQATRLWPDFAASDRVAGPDGPLPHPQYCRTMQHILVEYAQARVPGIVIAPVRVAPFTAWLPNTGTSPIQPMPAPSSRPTSPPSPRPCPPSTPRCAR
jgi:hypothetical protein